MATSPAGSPQSRGDHEGSDYDLLVQDPLPPAYSPVFPHQGDDRDGGPVSHPLHSRADGDIDALDALDDDDDAGQEAIAAGMPGRGVILVSLTAAGGSAGLDLALTGRLSMFFDLCFIVVCLVAAMGVRRRDLFTTGVLPPLVFGAVIGVIAVTSPVTFSVVGGFSKVVMTGLAQHAVALVAGYAVALVTVGGRVSVARQYD